MSCNQTKPQNLTKTYKLSKHQVPITHLACIPLTTLILTTLQALEPSGGAKRPEQTKFGCDGTATVYICDVRLHKSSWGCEAVRGAVKGFHGTSPTCNHPTCKHDIINTRTRTVRSHQLSCNKLCKAYKLRRLRCIYIYTV